jgi:hypothetical protein
LGIDPAPSRHVGHCPRALQVTRRKYGGRVGFVPVCDASVCSLGLERGASGFCVSGSPAFADAALDGASGFTT